MLLTDDDKKLEYEPRYDERPAVAPDPVERQCVDGDAARAERQHHAQDHRGQPVAVLISYRIIIIGKLVETVGRGGHPVPDGGQDGGQQMDEDQEDADESDEGVQRAAALAHGKIHHSSNQERVKNTLEINLTIKESFVSIRPLTWIVVHAWKDRVISVERNVRHLFIIREEGRKEDPLAVCSVALYTTLYLYAMATFLFSWKSPPKQKSHSVSKVVAFFVPGVFTISRRERKCIL